MERGRELKLGEEREREQKLGEVRENGEEEITESRGENKN